MDVATQMLLKFVNALFSVGKDTMGLPLMAELFSTMYFWRGDCRQNLRKKFGYLTLDNLSEIGRYLLE